MTKPNNQIIRFEDAHPAGQSTAMVDVASTRASQEVQAAMVVAKRFPRNETDSFNRIMQACRRPSLAEAAVYEFPKGGSKVTGPSIRLAEVLARAWGNLECGVTEIEQRDGESTMLAFAWDLETNTRISRTFVVKHELRTKQGTKTLTDPRDIYEMTANQGARRLRACILATIPGDVVDAAVTQCEQTMAGNSTEPLADRVRKMVVAFGDHGISQAMIEKRLGHALTAATEHELVSLRKVYQSIKDGMSGREQFFDLSAGAGSPMAAMTGGSAHHDSSAPGLSTPDERAEFGRLADDLHKTAPARHALLTACQGSPVAMTPDGPDLAAVSSSAIREAIGRLEIEAQEQQEAGQ